MASPRVAAFSPASAVRLASFSLLLHSPAGTPRLRFRRPLGADAFLGGLEDGLAGEGAVGPLPVVRLGWIPCLAARSGGGPRPAATGSGRRASTGNGDRGKGLRSAQDAPAMLWKLPKTW